MILPKPIPDPPSQPLPLFRTEAIEAQRQKFYGEILLIRPLSLTVVIWLGIGISAAVLAYLLLGTYTERMHIMGVLLAGGASQRQADFYVPLQAINFVQPGETLQVDCHSCPRTAFHATGRVSDVSKSAVSEEEVAAQLKTLVDAPMYRITLMLSPGGAVPVSDGAKMEAVLPLGRRPLLQWLFERGDSNGAGR